MQVWLVLKEKENRRRGRGGRGESLVFSTSIIVITTVSSTKRIPKKLKIGTIYIWLFLICSLLSETL